jgi:hypothetical protein
MSARAYRLRTEHVEREMEFFAQPSTFCMAAYFYTRRAEWSAAWRAARRSW